MTVLVYLRDWQIAMRVLHSENVLVPRGRIVANCDMFSYMYVRLNVNWVLLSSGFNQT